MNSIFYIIAYLQVSRSPYYLARFHPYYLAHFHPYYSVHHTIFRSRSSGPATHLATHQPHSHMTQAEFMTGDLLRYLWLSFPSPALPFFPLSPLQWCYLFLYFFHPLTPRLYLPPSSPLDHSPSLSPLLPRPSPPPSSLPVLTSFPPICVFALSANTKHTGSASSGLQDLEAGGGRSGSRLGKAGSGPGAVGMGAVGMAGQGRGGGLYINRMEKEKEKNLSIAIQIFF